MEESSLRGASLARLLLFSCRHLEARTVGCHSLDRRAVPLCNYHISADSNRTELCALIKPIPLESRKVTYPLLMCLPLQVQHPFIPMVRCRCLKSAY